MTVVDALCNTLARIAPLKLAESWDNVGLLIGDRQSDVARVMTCLTVSPCVVEEARTSKAEMIVTHHPIPFRAVQRITADSVTGRMLLDLIAAGVAVYSAHTAFDSAVEGINQMWSETLQLESVAPLTPHDELSEDVGAGRYGTLVAPMTLEQLSARVADAVNARGVRRVGDGHRRVHRVAIACGSGGSFLSAAARKGCDAMVTGEATFHTCLEAESLGVGLTLLGHYWSERFAMERLAQRLSEEHPELDIWPSRTEFDPIVPVEPTTEA